MEKLRPVEERLETIFMLSEPSAKKLRLFLKLRENQLFKGFRKLVVLVFMKKVFLSVRQKFFLGKKLKKESLKPFQVELINKMWF